MITVQLEPGGPITEADETTLHRRVGREDNDNEIVNWVEYRLNPGDQRAIHRSVHLHLKKPMVFSEASVGGIA